MLTLSNSGAEAASGLSLSFTGPFARNGGSCGTTLGATDSCDVLVSFAPTGSGNFTGSILMTYADSSGSESDFVTLAATRPAQGSLLFDACAYGCPIGEVSAGQDFTLSIRNISSATLSAPQLDEPVLPPFEVVGSTCSVPLMSMQACEYTVHYDGSSEGWTLLRVGGMQRELHGL